MLFIATGEMRDINKKIIHGGLMESLSLPGFVVFQLDIGKLLPKKQLEKLHDRFYSQPILEPTCAVWSFTWLSKIAWTSMQPLMAASIIFSKLST